jgi:hypothetical protein
MEAELQQLLLLFVLLLMLLFMLVLHLVPPCSIHCGPSI